MRRKVILCSFIPLGFIFALAITIVIVKNSKWASQKCENSIGYASTGYEFDNTVSGDANVDNENKKETGIYVTGIYLDETQFVEFHLDSEYIDGDCIRLVISYVGGDKDSVVQMTDNVQYTVVDEYEIDSVGWYSFEMYDFVNGWYLVSVKPGEDLTRANGTLKICTYDDNWTHLLNQIF